MRTFIFISLLVAYLYIGMSFHFSAMNGRIDPERPPWGFDLFRPELFTPDGQRLRRAALRYYVIGGTVLILGFCALAA